MNDTPKKILVIDDEPDMLGYIGSVLKDNGFTIETASNGKEGFEKAKALKPDLITLDITMPEESGVKTFKNFQETAETKNIPVIIITGVSQDFKKFIHSRKTVKAPAAYIEKPIETEDLVSKIKELIG